MLVVLSQVYLVFLSLFGQVPSWYRKLLSERFLLHLYQFISYLFSYHSTPYNLKKFIEIITQ